MVFDYLLFLEMIRNSTGGLFDSFFLFLTNLGELTLIFLILGLIYWCVDKKTGEFLFVTFAFSRLINGFLKITVCEVRPWITNKLLHPLEDALPAATGYSFPSGHANNATITFGGYALKSKIGKGFTALLIILIGLICFSRNYAGVHTFWDVAVSVILAVVCLFGMNKIFEVYGDKPNFDLIVAGVGILISVLLLIYTVTKGYPMNYDAAGQLIVDPAKMIVDSYENVGYTVGIFLGWVLERRFINFNSGGSVHRRLFRLLAGCLGFEFIAIFRPFLKSLLGAQYGGLLFSFIITFFLIFIMPALIKIVQIRNPEEYPTE